MRSDDPCPECGGYLNIYHTQRVRGTPWAKRYLKCGACGRTDCEIVELGPKRRRKSRTNVVRRQGKTARGIGTMKGCATESRRRPQKGTCHARKA